MLETQIAGGVFLVPTTQRSTKHCKTPLIADKGHSPTPIGRHRGHHQTGSFTFQALFAYHASSFTL